MVKMARKLRRWEQRRLRQKTEEARLQGGVSASLFLEGEMNALSDADCFFFFGGRLRPKGLLTVFFPDEEHAELTVAEFVPGEGGLSTLFASALRECGRVGVGWVYTVKNPACGFDLARVEGIRFVHAWSEYMLCNEMRVLASIEKSHVGEGEELLKEPEQDGTIRYTLLRDGQEAAECRILPTENGTQCYLFGLKTKEAFRRMGLATRLFTEIAKEYEEREGARMRLQVSSKNVPAERLYRKLGFWTEEQRDYYKTEEC